MAKKKTARAESAKGNGPNADTTYPAWFYGPEGQSAIFDAEGEVPEGWMDHPGAFAEQEHDEVVGRQPTDEVVDDSFYQAMSMDELRKHLTGKNIDFHPSAKREKLISLLRTARPEQGQPEN